jgi:hypothetical protein
VALDFNLTARASGRLWKMSRQTKVGIEKKTAFALLTKASQKLTCYSRAWRKEDYQNENF